MTVPPFHPHRVVGESRFRTGDPPEVVPVDAPLHAERPSASNLRNFVDRLGDAITIGWYSGDSASSGRGSLMVYNSTPRGAAGWYAGLQRRDAWRVVKLVGIGQREWDAPEARRATWPPRAPDFA